MNIEILNHINEILTKNGFKRKKEKVWYIDEKWFTFIFEIQPSRFSDIFFINYGAFFFELSNTKFNFKSDSIHLYGRLDPFNNDILTENSTKSEIDNYLNEILHTNIFNLFNNIKSPNEKFINAISESKEFSPQNVMPDNIIKVIKKHDENKNFVDIRITDK